MSIWKDSVAVVTGGASGLGAATARELADTGMKVIIINAITVTTCAPKIIPNSGLAAAAESNDRTINRS